MKNDYRVFSKLLSILLTIFVLASCNTLAPEVTPDNVIPLDLTQVDVDLDAGTITGTTAAMEYSLNSTDGVDGTWTAASEGNTSVTLVEGKVYIREAANHQNVRLVKTIGPDNTIIVDLDEVGINVAEGNITGTSTDMEYSLNSTNGTDGTWTAASNVNTAVAFIAGKVYVRETADHDNQRLVATIAAAAAAPTLASDDDANTITGLTATHEYKIDAGAWTIGTTVPDLTGAKSVQVRIKATASALPSQVQTIVFTENAASLIVLFEDNFDDLTKDLETDLNYVLSPNKALISTAQHVSGTRSLGFLKANGTGYVSRYFNPTTKAGDFENVSVELKVKVTSSTGGSSYVIGLYNDAGLRVAGINLFSGYVRYYNATGAATQFSPTVPLPLDEWFTIRIAITGDTFSVYKDGDLLMGNIPTEQGRPGAVTRLYCSLANTNVDVFLDDIKASHLPVPD